MDSHTHSSKIAGWYWRYAYGEEIEKRITEFWDKKKDKTEMVNDEL